MKKLKEPLFQFIYNSTKETLRDYFNIKNSRNPSKEDLAKILTKFLKNGEFLKILDQATHEAFYNFLDDNFNHF